MIEGARVIEPRDLDALVQAVRGAEGASVLVLLRASGDAVADAAMRAAIGPLAIERAPETRVNALLIGELAAPEALDAAARYLSGATSTTGQLIAVSG